MGVAEAPSVDRSGANLPYDHQLIQGGEISAMASEIEGDQFVHITAPPIDEERC